MADTNEKICFVIAPIGKPESGIRKRSDQVLEHIIRPVVESCGYKAVRADEIAEPGMIPTQIIRHVVEDPLVIADLTGQNANVFYELAIRHYIGKPLIQIINNVEDIPFDVGSMRTIVVNHQDLDSVEEAKTEIKRQIQSLEKSSSSLENPISVALDGRSIDEIKKRDQDYLDEIKKIQDQNDEILRRINAETVADDPEEAKQAVVNIRVNPTASLIHKAIAQAVFSQQQGKRDEAIEKWRAVAQIAEGIDNNLAARAWLSVGYLLGNSKDSISAYDRAISLKSDYADAYNNRGATKSELGQHEDAIADFDEVIRLKPDYAEAYYNRGKTKGALGQRDKAIADYDEAIRLKPDAEAYINRGVAKGALGQRDEAIADFDEAIRLKPDLVEAYNNRGTEKAALGQRDEAIADFDEAIRLKPDLVEAYNNRGAAKGELGRHEDAIADFDEAIRLKPDYVGAYNNRGTTKRVLGQHDEAITDCDEAIRLKPDYAEAYNNRGAAKGELGRQEDAIADFDEAIRLKPDYAEAYYDRGVVKGELSHYEDAIADFDEAIRLKPSYVEAYIHRGVAKGELDLIDEARQNFENARDLARDTGNDSLADMAEQRLRGLDADDT